MSIYVEKLMLHIKDNLSYFTADGELKEISALPTLGLWSKWNSSQKAQGSSPWKTRNWAGWVFLISDCPGYHRTSMLQRNIQYFSSETCVHKVFKIWLARWLSGTKVPEAKPHDLTSIPILHMVDLHIKHGWS